MTSRPVYTSTADGYRDAKEIAALRPVAAAKPRAPRKPAARVAVSTGIVCFCGERFAESQALEFMKHLRAEVGEVLEWRERQRQYVRKHDELRRQERLRREEARAREIGPEAEERRQRANRLGRERYARKKTEREANDNHG